MTQDQAHAGNGPAPLPGSQERTIEQVMTEDIVPSTSALRDALRCCAALIEASADTARDPQNSPGVKTEAAVAAARLGATTAQLMSALARAADSDTRLRLANMRLQDADRRQTNAAHRQLARRARRESRPLPVHDDFSLYERDDDDFDEKNLDFNSGTGDSGEENLNFNSTETGPRIRQL